MNVNDIHFPVLQIQERDAVSWARSAGELTECSTAAFNRGWFDNQIIIDAGGRMFRISGGRVIRKKGKLFKSIFAPTLVEVELNFSGPVPISLEEVKKYAIKAIKMDSSYLNSTGESMPEIRKTVKNAPSIKEIWQMLEPLLAEKDSAL